MNQLNYSELKYSCDCICNGTQSDCSDCYGRNVIPIGNISFAEMRFGTFYVVKIYDSKIGECMLKKTDDRHVSCTFFYLDRNGELSVHSEIQTISFPLELLDELRKMQADYLEVDNLVEHLRNYRLLEKYDLETLANTVAIGIHEAVFGNRLLDYDQKHGTSLCSYITAQPTFQEASDKYYRKLLLFVAKEMKSGRVTLIGALRQFEKEKDGSSVIQVLLDAEKTFDQFLREANCI
jgi:hypothetical protein